jgi:hypothetical protein
LFVVIRVEPAEDGFNSVLDCSLSSKVGAEPRSRAPGIHQQLSAVGECMRAFESCYCSTPTSMRNSALDDCGLKNEFMQVLLDASQCEVETSSPETRGSLNVRFCRQSLGETQRVSVFLYTATTAMRKIERYGDVFEQREKCFRVDKGAQAETWNGVGIWS